MFKEQSSGKLVEPAGNRIQAEPFPLHHVMIRLRRKNPTGLFEGKGKTALLRSKGPGVGLWSAFIREDNVTTAPALKPGS